MKKVVEYQPIVDEFIRTRQGRPLVFRSPGRRKQKQQTLADLYNLHLPDATMLEVEYQDGNGYHLAPVSGVWESESGGVVLTVGKDTMVPERSD